jgi:hypothetical protein
VNREVAFCGHGKSVRLRGDVVAKSPIGGFTKAGKPRRGRRIDGVSPHHDLDEARVDSHG